MKLLFGYTFDYIKRNRRASLSIIVAVLMTSTMLSALCGFLFNMYWDNLNMVLHQTGNWHGELYDATPGSMLPVIEGFDSVEAMMIKGNWKTAQIDDPRRDYLVWRDANAEYWESMPEGELAIMEGRPPAGAGEIALSKQYFENHKELQIGDSITLPTGRRVDTDGSYIDPQERARRGERFEPDGTVTLTVVAKLDVANSSVVPAYTALGFLDPETILPDDELTVYLRFHNIRDTYKALPEIAGALGYEPDEYGNYLLRYNTAYLSRRAVLSPEQTGLLPMLVARQQPLMFLVIGLLTVGMFVLIIHGAFSLSSSARLSQIGIFASVGASPRQIKRSVLLKAFLLTLLPLPAGLVLGQICVKVLIGMMNRLNTLGDMYAVVFRVGWQSILPAVLLTFLTVWWSALIPARRIARMSPIDAIRQGRLESLKKPRRFALSRLAARTGIFGELAANALQARRKSYRTATVSLTLSFLTLACFLCSDSASLAGTAVYRSDEMLWEEQDILLTLRNVETQEEYSDVTERIGGVQGVASALWFSTLRTAAWLPEDSFSPEFEEKGGFAAVEDKLSPAQVPLLRDGRRRVEIVLLGLDDTSFAAYCDALGIDEAPFYDEDRWRGILYHTVHDVGTSTLRNPVTLPFFDISPGDVMTLTETTSDSYEGDFTFDIEAAAIAQSMPPTGSTTIKTRNYSAAAVMPMSRIRQLAGHFARSNIERVNGVIQAGEPSLIKAARTAVERICESNYGSGDYWIVDEEEYFENGETGRIMTALMFGFVAVLLAVIGLSNAWSTVRGTLNARRREFAMLRSVGLPPKGLRRMLAIEAVILGVTPILLSLPAAAAVQWVFLSVNELTFAEWLRYAPWMPVLSYTACILAVTLAAYAVGARRLLRENIIEAVKID